MSDFWSLYFKFDLQDTPFHFIVEMQNPSFSPKDNTLKVSGFVNLEQVDILTAWQLRVGVGEYKTEAVVPNGAVLGCWPSSMTFNTIPLNDMVHKAQERLWKSHMVIHYDTTCQNFDQIQAIKTRIGLIG